MSTMYYNRLEIEFADEKSKDDFKKLTNTEIGKNELLDFSVVFPIPWQIVDNEKETDLFIQQFWDYSSSFTLSDNDDNDTSDLMQERGLVLEYHFATKSQPPLTFIKELYLYYFKINKIRLAFNSEDDTIFLNRAEDELCKEKSCNHEDCVWHFVDWTIELDWSKLPHPIFEVDKTLQHIRKLYPKETDEMIGRIYHHLLVQLSCFRRFNSSPFVAARTRFEEQAMDCENEYLAVAALAGNYNLPTKLPRPVDTKSGIKKYAKLLVKYWKVNVRAKRNDPLLKRKKRK